MIDKIYWWWWWWHNHENQTNNMSGLDVRDTCRISGTATKQMIAAISKQVRKDIVRFPKWTPSDVTFKGTRLDENDNDVEYNDDFVDTGGFEASGIGKPAEPSSFHPVEGTQSSFGEFAVCMIDDGWWQWQWWLWHPVEGEFAFPTRIGQLTSWPANQLTSWPANQHTNWPANMAMKIIWMTFQVSIAPSLEASRLQATADLLQVLGWSQVVVDISFLPSPWWCFAWLECVRSALYCRTLHPRLQS